MNTSGAFAANLIVENSPDRSFCFVPLFAKTQDRTGLNVTARLSFRETGSIFIPPGGQLAGEVLVLGTSWNNPPTAESDER